MGSTFQFFKLLLHHAGHGNYGGKVITALLRIVRYLLISWNSCWFEHCLIGLACGVIHIVILFLSFQEFLWCFVIFKILCVHHHKAEVIFFFNKYYYLSIKYLRRGKFLIAYCKHQINGTTPKKGKDEYIPLVTFSYPAASINFHWSASKVPKHIPSEK